MILLAKRSVGFLVPGGIVFLAALAIIHEGYLNRWLHLINASMPYIVLGFGFLLGLRFHRSRLALAVLVMIVTDRALYYFGPEGAIPVTSQATILQLAILLLPINILLLYFAKDRSLLTPSGLFLLGLVAVQPLAAYVLIKKNIEYLHYLDHRVTSLPYLGKIAIPDTIILVYGGVLTLFFLYSLLRNKAVQKGFFWALLSAGFALYTIKTGNSGSFYFSTAGLIIVLSVIETAYRLAYHDALTGLPGRQALTTTLQNLGKNYTIAMLDIDFFKKFNDRYGHDVGDQVLCMVASHINRVGGGGKPFRYGGEGIHHRLFRKECCRVTPLSGKSERICRKRPVQGSREITPQKNSQDQAKSKKQQDGLGNDQYRCRRVGPQPDKNTAGPQSGRQGTVPRQEKREKLHRQLNHLQNGHNDLPPGITVFFLLLPKIAYILKEQ